MWELSFCQCRKKDFTPIVICSINTRDTRDHYNFLPIRPDSEFSSVLVQSVTDNFGLEFQFAHNGSLNCYSSESIEMLQTQNNISSIQ